MDRFEGRLAVITGGGTGMGRELARQLAAAQGGRIVHGTRLTPQNHSPILLVARSLGNQRGTF